MTDDDKRDKLRRDLHEVLAPPPGTQEQMAARLGIGPAANHVRAVALADERSQEIERWRAEQVQALVRAKGWSVERAEGFVLGALCAAYQVPDHPRDVVARAISKIVLG